MSRFFHSADSTPSSASSPNDVSSDEEGNGVTEELNTNRDSNASSSAAVNVPSANLRVTQRINTELSTSGNLSPSRRPRFDSPDIQARAITSHQKLPAQLVSSDLLPPGLETDQYAPIRERYRKGGNDLSNQHLTAGVSSQPRRRLTYDGSENAQRDTTPANRNNSHVFQPSIPFPITRLLTNDNDPGRPTSHGLAFGNRTQTQFLAAWYSQTFEELNILGHGGYGIVYRVRHRFDNQFYALKKVPLSAARLQRIRERGQSELDEVLREVRTLARLDHPNVVRYHTSWIDFVDSIAAPASLSHSNRDTVSGAETNSQSGIFDRVVTEIDFGDDLIYFEDSRQRPDVTASMASNASQDLTRNENLATLDNEGLGSMDPFQNESTLESVDRNADDSSGVQSGASFVQFREPTLVLHVQMSLHPMTLADFLTSPDNGNGLMAGNYASGELGLYGSSGSNNGSVHNTVSDTHQESIVPRLSHCFHVGLSIAILLAILEGLSYLHSEGIVHRDIKPSNIFLGSKTSGTVDLTQCSDCNDQQKATPIKLEVRLGDFGLASLTNPEGQQSSVQAPVGTETYRPPTRTVSSTGLDIYALGIVAFELLWKFNTRMERAHTIQKLKRGDFPGEFSKTFGAKRGPKIVHCIRAMLSHRNSISIPEIKELLIEIQSM